VSTFTTTLLQLGNNVGIEIPDAVVAELGGKRVPVVVTLDGGYSYRSTTAVMGGKNLVGLNAAHRAASGAAGGQVVEVTIVRDDAPREVEVPEALAAALAAIARSTRASSPKRNRMTPGPVAWRRLCRCCEVRAESGPAKVGPPSLDG
jgi:hypothetical protein